MKTFTEKVYKITKGIKRGRMLTYQQVAKLAGSPKAYRAVGNILNKNYNTAIPCHRVVRADGTAGGYNQGARQKIKLLIQEKSPLNSQSA